MGCMTKARWCNNEINILKNHYEFGGVDLCVKQGLNRSKYSIVAKARQLGLRYKATYVRKDDWCKEDIELLKKYYPQGGVMLCIEKGLNYTISNIHYKAYKLGLKIGRGRAKRITMWTDEELSILKDCYPKGGTGLCRAKGLTKTNYGIYLKANSLGLIRDIWDDNYLNILRTYYPQGGYKLCMEKGLNLSVSSINKKAKLEGLNYKVGTNWSEDEDIILKTYYPQGGYIGCIENGLNKGRSKSAVYTRVCKLKIGYKKENGE